MFNPGDGKTGYSDATDGRTFQSKIDQRIDLEDDGRRRRSAAAGLLRRAAETIILHSSSEVTSIRISQSSTFD